jgi:hypothetical protein
MYNQNNTPHVGITPPAAIESLIGRAHGPPGSSSAEWMPFVWELPNQHHQLKDDAAAP